MKRYLIPLTMILALVGVELTCSCSTRTTDVPNLSEESRGCSMISEKTAILIAQGALQTSYVESKFDISVQDGNENWVVRFATKCVDCEDGHPYVIVKKATGEISQVFRYGEPEKLTSPTAR